MKRALLLALFAHPLFGAIAFDTSTNGSDNGGGTMSLSFSHTCTGSNLLLILGLTGDTTADDITAVTYNSVSMTLVSKIQGTRWHYQYYLLGPSTGANTVSITASTSHFLIAVTASYTGVAQSGQPDATATGTSAVSPYAAALTTIANNAWVINTGWAFSTVTAGSNTTVRQRDGNFSSDYEAESSLNPISPAGSVTTNYNYSAAQTAAWVQSSWAPFTGGGGATPTGAKSKKLLKLDASTTPPTAAVSQMILSCQPVTAFDCNGYQDGNSVVFACTYPDGSCSVDGITAEPIAMTSTGLVAIPPHLCIVGANLGTAAVPIGFLGSVDPGYFSFDCTP